MMRSSSQRFAASWNRRSFSPLRCPLNDSMLVFPFAPFSENENPGPVSDQHRSEPAVPRVDCVLVVMDAPSFQAQYGIGQGCCRDG